MAFFGGFKSDFLRGLSKQNNESVQPNVAPTSHAKPQATSTEVPIYIPPGDTLGLSFLWSSQVDCKTLENTKTAASKGDKNTMEIAQVKCIAFCPFEPYEKFAAVGDNKGNVSLVEVGVLGISGGNTFGTEDFSVRAISWFKDSKDQIRVVSTEKEETIVIWRVNFEKKTLQMHYRCLDVISESTHKGLKCLATHPVVPDMIATAGESGTIFIYHQNRTFPTHKIKKAHYAERPSDFSSGFGPKRSEIVGLLIKNKNTIISAGAVDRKIKIWNLAQLNPKKAEPITVFDLNREITSITLAHADVSKLYASCLDGSIYCYDTDSKSNLAPIQKYMGHSVDEKTTIKVSPCGFYLASSSTTYIYVWDTKKQYFNTVNPLLFKLKGHSKDITCFDWCHSSGLFKMLSTSDDKILRAWRQSEDIKDFSNNKGAGYMEIINASFRKYLESLPKFPFLKELETKSPPKMKTQEPITINKSDDLEVDEEYNSSDYTTDEEMYHEDEEEDDESSYSDDQNYLENTNNITSLESGDEYLPDDVWLKLSKL